MLARYRPKERSGLEIGEVPFAPGTAALDQPSRQMRALIDHGDRVTKQNLSLILIDRSRIDLRSRLAIGQHHVKPDASRQGRLAIALRQFDEGYSKAPRVVRRLPAEQGADDELLALVQYERLALVLAAVQTQHITEEADRPFGRVSIPSQSTRRSMPQIVEMSLAGEMYQRAGRDLARADPPGVALGRIR